MIKMTMFACVAIYVAMAALFFIGGVPIMGVIFVVLALLHALFFYLWRNRIELAALILETVVSVYRKYAQSFRYCLIKLDFPRR